MSFYGSIKFKIYQLMRRHEIVLTQKSRNLSNFLSILKDK